MRPGCAIVLTVAMMASLTVAQNVPQTPKLRVTTRLVQIDVIVRDRKGPVENLTKDDFAIFDRGKPRAIGLFAVESAESAKVSTPPAPLPPNTFTDLPQYQAATARSITVILLDNLNTLYGSTAESQYETSPNWMEGLALRNAKLHLIEFVKQMQPEDRVAIYGLRHSLHVLCDFTSDRAQLISILNSYDDRSITNRRVVEPGKTIVDLRGHDNPANDVFVPGSSFENGASLGLARAANKDRGAETMAALQEIAGHLANIPGRKNLVWLTANLPFSSAAMAHVLSPANIAVYPVDARGLLARSLVSLADIPGTADADDVSGASGHMSKMPAQSAQPTGITTMQKLADETGGQAFVNTNDITGAIRKAVEDSAVTYTLGFYIRGDSLDGKFHEIKIEVKQRGLTVRYPKGYFAFPDTAPTKTDDQRMLVTVVQSPIESSTIPLRATVERANQPVANSLKILCSIDAHSLHLAQSGDSRKGSIEVYIIEQDQTGKVVFESRRSFDLQVPEKQYASLLHAGMLFHEYVQRPAEATTLRVLVEDPATSSVGSLIIPLAQVN
ncbi:MAG TPA: VWA domain-containing protein [Candidatus Acidoferrales bacterium]|nr:VWA domain-containing protein [Candidatus Acidoferrales bacterium]